jgi:hemoglobin
MTDLTSRADVERLVDAFYDQVRADARLGPIFDGIAQVDWAAHLPRMYDFWETVLFGAPAFKGNPLAVHRALASRAPMSGAEFGQWLHLFERTVDTLFAGPGATEAKRRAAHIATVMQHHIGADRAAGVAAG